MTDKITLKPCPFCGGKAYFLHGRKNECITCEECGHRFYSLEIGEDAQKELWKQWNTRPIEDELRKELRRFKKYSAALEQEVKTLRGALETILDASQKDDPCVVGIRVVAYEALKGGEKCGTKSGKQKSPEEAAKFWNERRAFIDIFPRDAIAFMVKFYKELGKILIENKKMKTALKIYEDAMWEGLAATGMQDSCWEIIDKAKERVEKLLKERKENG